MHISNAAASVPESILLTHPEATLFDSGIDAINAIALRSYALVELLIEYFQTPEEHRTGRLPDSMMVNYLWQLSGNMELLQLITNTTLRNLDLGIRKKTEE